MWFCLWASGRWHMSFLSLVLLLVWNWIAISQGVAFTERSCNDGACHFSFCCCCWFCWVFSINWRAWREDSNGRQMDGFDGDDGKLGIARVETLGGFSTMETNGEAFWWCQWPRQDRLPIALLMGHFSSTSEEWRWFLIFVGGWVWLRMEGNIDDAMMVREASEGRVTLDTELSWCRNDGENLLGVSCLLDVNRCECCEEEGWRQCHCAGQSCRVEIMSCL